MNIDLGYQPPVLPAVQVLPEGMDLTEVDGIAVTLSDIWHGIRGVTKSKPSGIALAERMANEHDAFIVRPEVLDGSRVWAVRMILVDRQPMVVVRSTDGQVA